MTSCFDLINSSVLKPRRRRLEHPIFRLSKIEHPNIRSIASRRCGTARHLASRITVSTSDMSDSLRCGLGRFLADSFERSFVHELAAGEGAVEGPRRLSSRLIDEAAPATSRRPLRPRGRRIPTRRSLRAIHGRGQWVLLGRFGRQVLIAWTEPLRRACFSCQSRCTRSS